MLRLITLLTIFFSVFLNSYAQSTGGGYVTDEIFIRFKDSASEQQKNTFAQIHQLKKIRSFFITKAILFKIESGIDASELANSLNENPSVKYADLNRLGYKPQSIGINEPKFPYQWYLSGTFFGSNTNTINWLEAMSLYSGKENTVVAVVDSGLAFGHPEFSGKIGGMIAEQNGVDGEDDDGFTGLDGRPLIDDKFGWDFVNWDPIPEDDIGHGTLVSGIISSNTNNNEGGSGIAPDSIIIPLKTGESVPDSISTLLATEYAILNGARVINISSSMGLNNTMNLAVQEGVENLDKNFDILVVCAAGNSSSNNDQIPTFPASYVGDSILSVAASNMQNELAAFSNYGLQSVDIAAPGTAIYGPNVSRNIIIEDYFDNDWGWSWDRSAFNQSNYFWRFFRTNDGRTWVTDSDIDSFNELLDYAPNTDTSLRSPAIDLRGSASPELSVRVYHDLAWNWLIGSYDWLFFEISNDEINWHQIGLPVYGTTPYPGRIYKFDLRKYENQIVKIRFRLKTDSTLQSDGVYIDDFIITSQTPFNYSGAEYGFNDGTSFAAPIVSGVAAMLLSHRPELSTQDVRKIILQSVTKVDGLADKVASGGIVNAYEAIKLADAWEIETEAPLFYTLSSSVSPTGAGSVSGTGSYEEGSTASLSAESADGYVFSHWSGDASGSSNPVSVTINQDMSIVANFSATDTPNESSASFNLSSSVSPTGAGSVSGIASYEEGSTASLSAESADGYVFSHWSGDASGSSNPISVTINQDMSIVANFSATDNPNESSASFNLSSSVSPTGAGSVSGTGSYEEGSTASLSAESADGYVFSHWSGDASDSSNPISVTINQDMSIVAHFSATDNSNSWSSSSNIGNNLKFFSWFGQFFEINSNWIYHLKLGWLYRHGDNLTSLWFYSSKHGWLFTSKNIFPYLFQHSKDSWIYLQDNQLYSWANQSWTAI